MDIMKLAVLPSLILFVLVWRMDKIEKEPPKLLAKLFAFGALTVISAIILELAGAAVVKIFLNEKSLIYIIIDNFILTALVEETGKYVVLRKLTWKHPAFDYTFDAVVYAVAASLGFATVENILYVSDGSISTALLRAFFSIPGHTIFAIYMGYYYGMAKAADSQGQMGQRQRYLNSALLVPVLIHGFYDFCLGTQYTIWILIFFIFEIIITILAIRKILALSKGDTQIPGTQKTETAMDSSASQNTPQTNEIQDIEKGRQ